MNAASEYIREAIQLEQYSEALAQWNGYARQLRAAVEAGALPADQMEEARALFTWSRQVLLGARAQLRARFHELEVAAAYTGCPGRSEPRPGLLDTRF
jgi:hypothetical protein